MSGLCGQLAWTWTNNNLIPKLSPTALHIYEATELEIKMSAQPSHTALSESASWAKKFACVSKIALIIAF